MSSNTYGIQAINESAWATGVKNWEKPGGGKDLVLRCRTLAAELDLADYGNVEIVNEACRNASAFNGEHFSGRYQNDTDNGWFDIAHQKKDPFPPAYWQGYLNTELVIEAVGSPINYSFSSEVVSNAFQATGDKPRDGHLSNIAYVLDSGIKVALIYGDRDYACNWIGGELSSLAVPYSSAEEFAAAGYQSIVVNNTYVGGQVRQYGNYSFSRVYQAGHMVPAYQPETAYKIFMRAMFNKDVATGTIPLTDEYVTKGPLSSFHIKNEIPERPPNECYILQPSLCTEEEWRAVENGTAIIENYIFKGFGADARKESVVDHVYNENGQSVLGE